MASESTQRKHRRKELLEQMHLMAELACESHNKRHIAQVFALCLKLLRITATNDSVKEFELILRDCCEPGDSIIRTGKDVYVNGTINMEEFAKQVVWIGTHIEELGS